MRAFFGHELGLIVLALLMSTTLWLLVNLDQNPSESNWFNSIPVEVTDLPTGLVLRSDVPVIRIRVSAPRDVWLKRGLQSDRFKATIDASKAGAGINELPIKVVSLEPLAKVEET